MNKVLFYFKKKIKKKIIIIIIIIVVVVVVFIFFGGGGWVVGSNLKLKYTSIFFSYFKSRFQLDVGVIN